MSHHNPDAGAIERLLRSARRIAVVGLSPKPERYSHRIARYLIRAGYEVVPVYPREQEILGARVYGRLQDVPGHIDIVDVFRRSEALPEAVDDAIAVGARAIWLQLGCIDEAGAARATAAGITVVMDRCIMVDHAQLCGRPA